MECQRPKQTNRLLVNIVKGRMVAFNQSEFIEFMFKRGVVGIHEDPVKLSSTQRLSKFYVDWRNATKDAFWTDVLSDYIIAFVKGLGLKPDCFHGVPEGASKWAVISQYEWAKRSENYGPGSHPLSMSRGKPKLHGLPEDSRYVGTPKGKTIVLEDVTKTAKSTLETVHDLRGLDGVEIVCVLALTNRMELTPIPGVDDEDVVKEFGEIFEKVTGKRYKNALSVEEVFEEADIRYESMSNTLLLLPEIYSRLKPKEDDVKLVKEYFERYGTREVKLGLGNY